MGRVFRMGDGVNTDEIIAGRHNLTTDRKALGAHVFSEVRPELAGEVQSGDVLVAGRNFGCGSSREHAPIAIAGAGFACVVAASFARIFFRNAINVGLPVMICPEACELLEEGEVIQLDRLAGTLTRKDGRVLRGEPLSPFLARIVDAGGLVPFLQSNELSEADGCA